MRRALQIGAALLGLAAEAAPAGDLGLDLGAVPAAFLSAADRLGIDRRIAHLQSGDCAASAAHQHCRFWAKAGPILVEGDPAARRIRSLHLQSDQAMTLPATFEQMVLLSVAAVLPHANTDEWSRVAVRLRQDGIARGAAEVTSHGVRFSLTWRGSMRILTAAAL